MLRVTIRTCSKEMPEGLSGFNSTKNEGIHAHTKH